MAATLPSGTASRACAGRYNNGLPLFEIGPSVSRGMCLDLRFNFQGLMLALRNWSELDRIRGPLNIGLQLKGFAKKQLCQMLSIHLSQRKPQYDLVATRYEPCHSCPMLNRNLFHIWWDRVIPFSARQNSSGSGLRMTAPVGTSFVTRMLASAKHATVYVITYAKRIATLEARVTMLEMTLTKRPPDVCCKCGKQAMRVSKASEIQGCE